MKSSEIKKSYLKNENKTIIAYNKIKKSIIRNELKPNTVLIENQLSEALKMSRTPIRNALSKLVNEGFLDFIKNKGIFVSNINLSDILEIYNIRFILDPFLLEESFKKNKEKVYKQLNECLKAQEKALQKDDFYSYVENDLEFHKIYMFGSNYKMLHLFLNSTMDQLLRYSFTSVGDIDRAEKSLLQHKGIFEAYEQNNIDKANILVKKHIEDIKKYYIHKLANL